MKFTRSTALLVSALLLSGCATGNTSAPGSSHTADPVEAPLPDFKESLIQANQCQESEAVPASDLSNLEGEICFFLDGTAKSWPERTVTFSFTSSQAEALEFAKSAYLHMATLPYEDFSLNDYDWFYRPKDGLVMTGPENVVESAKSLSNMVTISRKKDVAAPVNAARLSELVAAVRRWDQRCMGNEVELTNPHKEAVLPAVQDTCYTAARLTETVVFSSWLNQGLYLEQQQYQSQAPTTTKYLALVGDGWAVVDTVANDRLLEILAERIGDGEIIDLEEYDMAAHTQDHPLASS